MMKIFAVAMIALFQALALFSQAPTIQWQKCLGGSSWEWPNSLQQTRDGGYIIAGWTQSNNGDVSGNHGDSTFRDDYWIVKLNSFGSIQWQKCLGGLKDEKANSIQQTSNGGYIIAGISYSNDGDVSGHYGTTYYSDYWIVNLDSAGEILWQKSLGGTAMEWAGSVQQTSDAGYIVAGSTESTDGDVKGNHGNIDMWIVKLNPTADILWQRCLGGGVNDYTSSIQQTPDKGFIIAGTSNSNDGNVSGNNGGNDFWIVKLDSLGILQWQKSLGGTLMEEAYSVQLTNDGGYIVAGASNSNDADLSVNHGGFDCWVVKLNPAGNIQWQKSLGGSRNDYANSIQQTSDSGYIVAGYTASIDGDVSANHGKSDYWIVKLSPIGDLLWQKSLGGSLNDYASSIQQTSDGGYVVAGYSESNDGDVSGNHGGYDYWIVKLSPDGTSVNDLNPDEDNQLSLAEDQTGRSIKISYRTSGNNGASLKLFNICGLEIKSISKEISISGWNSFSIPTDDFTPGIYFCTLQSGTGLITRKFVITK